MPRPLRLVQPHPLAGLQGLHQLRVLAGQDGPGQAQHDAQHRQQREEGDLQRGGEGLRAGQGWQGREPKCGHGHECEGGGGGHTRPPPACPNTSAEGRVPTTPTTRVKGRFQETMPMSPDSASCRHTPSSEDGEGSLLGSVAQSSPPPAWEEPPKPCWPRAGPGAAGPYGLLLCRKPGEIADSGQQRARGLQAALCRAARPGPARCRRVTPGSCPHPVPMAGRASRGTAREQGQAAPYPSTLPLPHPAHPSPAPSDRPVSASPRYMSPTTKTRPWGPHPSQSPQGNPRDSPAVPCGSPPAQGGGAAGPHSPRGPAANSARRFGSSGDPELQIHSGPLSTRAPAPHSPRSRPRRGRSDGSWRRA